MKRIGRPRGDNNLDKSYTIRMDDATHSRLEMYCKFMNIAKSEAIRLAINKMVNERLSSEFVVEEGESNE